MTSLSSMQRSAVHVEPNAFVDLGCRSEDRVQNTLGGNSANSTVAGGDALVVATTQTKQFGSGLLHEGPKVQNSELHVCNDLAHALPAAAQTPGEDDAFGQGAFPWCLLTRTRLPDPSPSTAATSR